MKRDTETGGKGSPRLCKAGWLRHELKCSASFERRRRGGWSCCAASADAREALLIDIGLKSVRSAGVFGGLRHHYQPPRLRAFWENLSAQPPRLAKAGTPLQHEYCRHSRSVVPTAKQNVAAEAAKR
jgi:hypothetical protein